MNRRQHLIREEESGRVLFCMQEKNMIKLPAIVIFIFPVKQKKTVETPEFSEVSQICELATLKCYYHDVTEYQKEANRIGFLKYGAKKMWMEYSGIVRIGIDVGKAHNNAKTLLKQYVTNVDKQIGQDYTVQWIEDKK